MQNIEILRPFLILLVFAIPLILIFVFMKYKRGDFYYKKYPIPKEIEEMQRRGESISSSDMEKVMSSINPLLSKEETLQQFKESVQKIKNGQDIEPWIKTPDPR